MSQSARTSPSSRAQPSSGQPSAIPEISPVDAFALLQAGAARLLDVREPDEYAAAHVEGAHLLPLGQLSAGLTAEQSSDSASAPDAHPAGARSGARTTILEATLSQAAPAQADTLIVICRSGRRSAEAVRLLQQAGLSGARNLTGGIIAWRAAGLPVVE